MYVLQLWLRDNSIISCYIQQEFRSFLIMDSCHEAETDEDSTPLMSTSDDDYSSEIQQVRHVV